MSAYRARRLGRRAAERLLRGEPAAGNRALHDLLAAATAHTDDGDVAGEDRAVMAFRAARLDPVPRLRRRSMIKTTLAKLLSAKIAAAAIGAVAVGGVATAAATGNLPASLGGHSNVAPATSTTRTASDGSAETTSKADSTGGATAGDHPSPSPSLVGLCHAFTAGAGSDHGKALESPAFTDLITTAGGTDKVDTYCTGLLAQQKTDPSEMPTSTDSNAKHDPATQNANARNTNARNTQDPNTAHPTGAPSTHPSH